MYIIGEITTHFNINIPENKKGGFRNPEIISKTENPVPVELEEIYHHVDKMLELFKYTYRRTGSKRTLAYYIRDKKAYRNMSIVFRGENDKNKFILVGYDDSYYPDSNTGDVYQICIYVKELPE